MTNRNRYRSALAATLVVAIAATAGAGEPRVLGSFDSGTDPGWVPSTDQMMGGASVADVGATEGSLKVSGRVEAGFIYPWSGAAVGFEQPQDLSGSKELAFRARGDGRTYQSMLIVEGAAGAPPPTVAFTPGEEWSEVVIPLGDYAGADLTRVRAFTFVATVDLGDYAFEIDDVELR